MHERVHVVLVVCYPGKNLGPLHARLLGPVNNLQTLNGVPLLLLCEIFGRTRGICEEEVYDNRERDSGQTLYKCFVSMLES